jgi:hypothetical protein
LQQKCRRPFFFICSVGTPTGTPTGTVALRHELLEPPHLIPGIGSAADVTDQDTDNLKRIQRGIRASKKPGVTLSVYQESRIRHFHQTLDQYMAA